MEQQTIWNTRSVVKEPRGGPIDAVPGRSEVSAMPEMRAETEREAKRKGIAGDTEKPVDPQDLTSLSRPPDRHRTERPEPEPPSPDPSGSTPQPDPATHEEHLRRDGRPKGGATRGPS
jgi:hypothetical protein